MALHSKAVAMSKQVSKTCFLIVLVLVSALPLSYSLPYAPNPSPGYEEALSPEYYYLSPDYAPVPAPEPGTDQLPALAPEYPSPPPPPYIEQEDYAPIQSPSPAPSMATSDLDGTDQSTMPGPNEPVTAPSPSVIIPSNYSAEDEVDAFVQEQEAYSAKKKTAGVVLGVVIGVGVVGFGGFMCFKKKDKRRTQYYESLAKKREG